MSQSWAGILALLGAATLWGLIGTAAKFAFRDGVSAEELTFYRSLIAGLGFLVVSWRGPAFLASIRALPKRLWVHLALFSFFGVAGLEYSNLKAVETGGVGFAAVFLYLAPLWVALWSRIFFRERLTWKKSLSLALCVVGIAVVGLFGGGDVRFSAEALAWGLVSGFSYSLFYVFGRMYFRDYSALLLNGIAFTTAAIILLPAAMSGGSLRVEFSSIAWGAILFAGVFSTLFAYALYGEGVKRIDSTRASILCSIEPIVAMGAAYAVWRESMGLWGYAGAVLVLVGVSLAVMSESKNPRS